MKTNSRKPKRPVEAKTARPAKRKGDSRAASCSAWGVMWKSENRLDGITRHLIFRNCVPALFVTRKDARQFIELHYAYIAVRKDLRTEPHGWRVPIPVRVTITPNEKLRHGGE